MRKYTTPTLKITLRYKNGEVASDLDFDYLIFSIRNACYSIDKKIMASEVEEGIFTVELTQEETARMKINDNLEMEINFSRGSNKRFATDIKKLKVDRNLLDRIINNE